MLNVRPLESFIHKLHEYSQNTEAVPLNFSLFTGLNFLFLVKLFLHKVGSKDIILNLVNSYPDTIFQWIHTFAINFYVNTLVVLILHPFKFVCLS